MKKIISMLTVSALALGSLFADVSLELNHKGMLAQDGARFKYAGYDDTTGCVVFKVSSDTAGVVVDFDPVINQANAKSVKLDQYYGWVNFIDGAFKLQSGVWTERKVNRLKDDGAHWAHNEDERYKYGVEKGTVAEDITNLTYIQSAAKTPLSTAITYNSQNIFVTAAIVSNDYGTAGFEKELKSGFAFEGGFSLNEQNKLNFVFKTPAADDLALGFFWENKGLKEGLNFVAGLSIDRPKGKDTNFAIDLRARYELSETATLTTMNKFQMDNSPVVGTGRSYSIWDMVSLAVKTSDTVKLTMTAHWEYRDLFSCASPEGAGRGKLDFIPGVTYSPTKGVELSTGLGIETTGWPKAVTSTYKIPVVLHVEL